MESPLITMSAITGKPNDKEIYTYLKALKENGIDNVLSACLQYWLLL